MRLDVSVNMLTMQALNKGLITVLGGDQTRPNIHIEDITDIYLFFLDNPSHVGIFNAGLKILRFRYCKKNKRKSRERILKLNPLTIHGLIE